MPKASTPSDVVILFYAGHGASDYKRFYLLPVNGSLNDLPGTSVSDETITNFCRKTRGKIMVFLDACRSGKVKLFFAPKIKAREQITRPKPVNAEPDSFQFSERLATQVKKIIIQTQEIEKLRLEKERILKEHYLPMQRKLEKERIDTLVAH